MASVKVSPANILFVLLVSLFVKCSAYGEVAAGGGALYPEYPIGSQNFAGYSWDAPQSISYTTYSQQPGFVAKQATEVVAKDCDQTPVRPVPKDSSQLAVNMSNKPAGTLTTSSSSTSIKEQSSIAVPKQSIEQPQYLYSPVGYPLTYDQTSSMRTTTGPSYYLIDSSKLYSSMYPQYRTAPIQQPLQSFDNPWYVNLASRTSQPVGYEGSIGVPSSSIYARNDLERSYAYSGVQPPVVVRRPPYAYSGAYPARGIAVQSVNHLPYVKSSESTGLTNSYVARNMFKSPASFPIAKSYADLSAGAFGYDYGFFDDGQPRTAGTLCREKRQSEGSIFGTPSYDYSVDSPAIHNAYDYSAASRMSSAPSFDFQQQPTWSNGYPPQQRGNPYGSMHPNYLAPQSRAVEGIGQLVSGITQLWPMLARYGASSPF